MESKTINEERTALLQDKINELEGQLKDVQRELEISQKRFRIAVDFSDVTIFDYNIKTKKILTQTKDNEIFGIPSTLEHGIEEVIHFGIIAERSKESLRALFHEVDQGAATASATIYANALDGKERTLKLQMINIFNQSNEPVYAVGVKKDITEVIQFRREKEYSELLTTELTFIYEANVTQNKVLRCNKQWAKDAGVEGIVSLTDLLQRTCEKNVYSEDIILFLGKQSQTSIIETFRGGTPLISFEYRRKIENNRYSWFETQVSLIEDEITKDINMRVYISNIDKKKKKEKIVESERERYKSVLYKAQHDLLTGFYNKHVVTEKINEILFSDEGKQGVHVFFIIDLDYFKQVNDQFGHAFGDGVLSKTASKIRALFRDEDILGRIGGDEFIIFMKNVKDENIAFTKAKEICKSSSEDYTQDGIVYKPTVSIGIAVFDKHGQNFDELYRHSDIALYHAKEQGRNQYSMYHRI
ncbi:MAG: GGDEF domain-containing protein [Lachnospiraceae bacterium]